MQEKLSAMEEGLHRRREEKIAAVEAAAKAAGLRCRFGRFEDDIADVEGRHPYKLGNLFAILEVELVDPDDIRRQWATVVAPHFAEQMVEEMRRGERVPRVWANLVKRSRSADELVERVREKLVAG